MTREGHRHSSGQRFQELVFKKEHGAASYLEHMRAKAKHLGLVHSEK